MSFISVKKNATQEEKTREQVAESLKNKLGELENIKQKDKGYLNEGSKFVVKKLIARGGRGAVYKVKVTKYSRRFFRREYFFFAVKKLFKPDTDKHDNFAQQVLQSFSHTSKYFLKKYGRTDNGKYEITELGQEELKMRLNKLDFFWSDKRSFKERGLIFREIFFAIKELHDHGLIHLDLKPENILIDKKHSIKIIDLDEIKSIHQLNNSFVGTPNYIAPERVIKKRYKKRGTDKYLTKIKMIESTKADIYSLGIMLFESQRFNKDLQTEKTLKKMYWRCCNKRMKKLGKKPVIDTKMMFFEDTLKLDLNNYQRYNKSQKIAHHDFVSFIKKMPQRTTCESLLQKEYELISKMIDPNYKKRIEIDEVIRTWKIIHPN